MAQRREGPGRAGGTRGWVIGHVAGAPVVVSPGWLLAAVVLTFAFVPTVNALVPGLGAGAYVVTAIGELLIFGSVLLHEVAHAVVARRRGVAVREIAVTLLGGHTRMGAGAPTPGASAAIAVAGPLVNLAMGGVAWGLSTLLPTGGIPWLLVIFLAVSNGFVGVFNLLPGLPLDGGRVLEALIWRGTGRRSTGSVVAGWAGRAVAVGVLALALIPPLLSRTQPDLTQVIWSALIGAFLWSGAEQAIKGARSSVAVEAVSVQALMRPAVTLPASGSVADLDAADDARAGPGGLPIDHDARPDVVLLGADGTPAAYVDRSLVESVPLTARAGTPLSAVAVALPVGSQVRADLLGSDAVQAIGAAARTSPVMAVVGPAGVVGLLRARDVINALRTGT